MIVERVLWLLTCIVIFFVSCTPATATTIRVPSEAATIQAGMDAAAPGDTVLVASGVYLESRIRMKSGVNLWSESGDPQTTRVRSDQSGSVLLCIDVDSSASIRGLRFSAGRPLQEPSRGGGIFLADSAPLIENCWISGNEAGRGAGIACVRSSPTFIDCSIFSNVCDVSGAGVYCEDAAPSFSGCLISDNTATTGESTGGGLHCVNSSPSFEGSTFFLNFALEGAGVYLDGTSFPAFSGCLFERNIAFQAGGAVYAAGGSAPGFARCTFHGQSANEGAGLYLEESSAPVLEATIIAYSSQGNAVHGPGSAPSLSCSDVFGNAGGDWVGVIADQLGNGNFSADPLFCDVEGRDYTLTTGSPCLPPASPCGTVVGAFDQGCGAIAIESMTWAGIKGMYRRSLR